MMGTGIRTRTETAFTAMQNGHLQRQCACGQHTSAGSECEECRKQREETLWRVAIHPAPANEMPPIIHEALRSPGRPLDPATHALMQPRFGHDFSRVRIHTDAQAAESARAVNALAYTVGSDVVFDAGQYAPETSKGQRLIAHELAHVVQPTPGSVLRQVTAAETKPEAGTAVSETKPATISAVHPLKGSGTYRRGVSTTHEGVDIAAGSGTAVVAVLAGTVESITTTCTVGNSACGGRWGNNVLINHGDEGKTRYAHLSSVSVRKGDTVTQGQEIGAVGSTGDSTGNHLHLEWKKGRTVIDPCQKIEDLCPKTK